MNQVVPAVEVRSLVNRFGHQIVHDDLDMQIVHGEVFGIVGGSGSGKSVLLRTVLGLHAPRSGDVRIDGQSITELDSKSLLSVKRRYGVTFQHGALFSSLTVLENIELPMLEALGLPESVVRGLSVQKLRLVGLPDDAGMKFPAQLSGGMVKRAALARALALDPSLLFLDEPTAGLDPISAGHFDELLVYLKRMLGLTVVMVTHDLDTIYRTCDRIGVIVDGRMISGTLEDIVQHSHPWIREYFHGARSRAARGA
jgi:phospholipid/cholesterol/gamma-HCH transport system ATP-binding protein